MNTNLKYPIMKTNLKCQKEVVKINGVYYEYTESIYNTSSNYKIKMIYTNRNGEETSVTLYPNDTIIVNDYITLCYLAAA